MRKWAKTSGVLALTGAAAALALGGCGGSQEADQRESAGSRSPEPVDIAAVDIAYTRYVPSGLGDIFVMSADGSNMANLTRTPKISDNFLAWSADGKRIVYSGEVGRFSDIWVMNADGSERRNLTDTPRRYEYDPALSPDGEQIVFSGRNNHDLLVMDAEGGGRTNLTKSPNRAEGSPAFSPDGKRIVFSSSGISVINRDGTAQRKLTNKLGGYPTFSPDGKRIAFMGVVRGADYDRVWIMNADGSGAAPLAHGPRINSGPAFSPNGRRIVYVAASPRRPGIYVMKADGTRRVRLTRHHSDANPVWRLVPGH